MLGGCVPIIASDEFALPFGDLFPWDKVSIRVPETVLLRRDSPEYEQWLVTMNEILTNGTLAQMRRAAMDAMSAMSVGYGMPTLGLGRANYSNTLARDDYHWQFDYALRQKGNLSTALREHITRLGSDVQFRPSAAFHKVLFATVSQELDNWPEAA
jgi:hypothetical protein